MRFPLLSGFTIIELMLAVAIMGVLSTIALPYYQDYSIRAKVTEGLSQIAFLKKDISEGYIIGRSTTLNNVVNEWNGVNGATNPFSKYITTVQATLNTGVIIVTYGGVDASLVSINGQTLKLIPYVRCSDATIEPLDVGCAANVTISAIDWACVSATNVVALIQGVPSVEVGSLETKFAPASCR